MNKREALSAVAAHLAHYLQASPLEELESWAVPERELTSVESDRFGWAVAEMTRRLDKIAGPERDTELTRKSQLSKRARSR